MHIFTDWLRQRCRPTRIGDLRLLCLQGSLAPVSRLSCRPATRAILTALPRRSMSRVLASRLGPEGITVNTLACGPFQSKMMKETLEKFEESIVGGLPLGRIGTPEDVAGVCLFLSSRAGAYTTG